jgi:PAS domain S-box-containing protein
MKKNISSDQACLESQLRIARHKTKSSRELLDFALAEVTTLTSSKAGLVCSCNDVSREFTPKNIVSTVDAVFSVDEGRLWSHPDTAHLWAKVVRQVRPIVLNETEIPASLKKDAHGGGIRLKSFLSVPLFSGGDIAAVAGFAGKARPYTKKDIQNASVLMNLAWQAAQRMRLGENRISTGLLLDELKETLSIGFFWKSPDLKYQDCNQYFATLAGIQSPEEIAGKTDADLAWKEAAKILCSIDEDILKTGRAKLNHVHKFQNAYGAALWLNIHSVPIKDSKGNIIAIAGTINDITRQKQEEIRNMRLAAIIDSTDDAVVGMNPDGIITDWNRAAEKIYGYTPDEAIGMSVANLAPAGFEAEISDIFSTLRSGRRPAGYETKRKRKNGEIFDVSITAAPILHTDGSFAGISSIGRDITEKNRQIKELELYREFLKNIEDGCFELDLKGSVTYANPAAAFMFGYNPDHAIGAHYSQSTTPAEAEKLFAIFNHIYKTGQRSFIEEMEILRQDGIIQYFDLMVSPIVDESGRVSGFRCTIRNVTQRKQERRELERYRDFVLNAEDACFEFDFYGNALFCNEPTCRILGYTREEHMKLRHRQRYPTKEEADRSAAIIRKVYETGEPSGLYESRMLHKDGSIVTIEMNVNMIRDRQGNPIGWRGTGRDVSDRKKRQAELERYRDFMENIYDGCFEVDLAGRITYTNETGARRLGLTKEELTGMNNLQYTRPEEAKRVSKIYREIYRTGRPAFIDHYELLHKDGHTVFFEMSAALIRDEKGNPAGFRGTTRDITERKINQERLRASEAKYRFLTEKISDVVWTADINLVFNYISPSVRFALGYKPEELTGRDPGVLMTPASFARARCLLEDELDKTRRGRPDAVRFVEFEAAYRHKNGDTLWFGNIVSFIRDDKGEIAGIHGVSRNITERKQAVAEKEKLILELQAALSEVKTLSGLLPICSHCKKIRDDKGYWNQLESYLLEHSGALLSHGICPECAEKYYPDILKPKKPK